MPTLTHIDTACTLLEIDGWRLLTDPVFDPPGQRYFFGWGTSSRKTGSPALSPEDVGPVDAVLLSHHQHGDNLDRRGLEVAAAAPLVLSTPAGARRFPRGMALREGFRHRFTSAGPDRPGLTVTAMPARHRPAWIPAFAAGPATGFLLSGAALPGGPMHITGDTVLTDALRRAVTGRGIDVLVAHVGGVRFPWITGPARYTLDARETVELAELSGARIVVAVHTGGWTHFREGPDELRAAFATAGIGDRLRIPEPGVRLDLG